jgi:hypothetical protein
MQSPIFRHLFSPSKIRLVLVLALLAIALAWATTPPVFANGVNSIVSSKNPSFYGESVTFTATFIIANAPTTNAPQVPQIQFYDGNTLLGPGSTTYINNTFRSTFTTSALTVGTHRITATFGQSSVSLDQVVTGASDVPEGDTLVLLGGGMGGLGVWLRYQWSKRRKK